MALSDDLDSVFFGFALAIGGLLSLITGYRLVTRGAFFDRLCCLACLLFTVTQVASVVYAKVMWLAPGPRYILVYLPINLGFALIYYLYDVRLSVFFRSTRAVTLFSRSMAALLVLYCLETLALVCVFYPNAMNTASGGYTVNSGPGTFPLKVLSYIIDMVIGSLILFGTIVALRRIIAENDQSLMTAVGGVAANGVSAMGRPPSVGNAYPPRASESAQSSSGVRAGAVPASSFYRIILASDITKFIFVFAIEIYKAATSFDPSNQLGALPTSNNSFQHVLDSIKISIMVGNLLLPSGIAKIVNRTSQGSSGAGKNGSRSGTTATAVGSGSAVSSGAGANKLGTWGAPPSSFAIDSAPTYPTTAATAPGWPATANGGGYGVLPSTVDPGYYGGGMVGNTQRRPSAPATWGDAPPPTPQQQNTAFGVMSTPSAGFATMGGSGPGVASNGGAGYYAVGGGQNGQNVSAPYGGAGMLVQPQQQQQQQQQQMWNGVSGGMMASGFGGYEQQPQQQPQQQLAAGVGYGGYVQQQQPPSTGYGGGGYSAATAGYSMPQMGGNAVQGGILPVDLSDGRTGGGAWRM
ncbi:hypothetical protein HK405_008351 [Cladochytrium tenue]|nr:hypothetical protein HK405_008351 [Cladochytrium tenue]